MTIEEVYELDLDKLSIEEIDTILRDFNLRIDAIKNAMAHINETLGRKMRLQSITNTLGVLSDTDIEMLKKMMLAQSTQPASIDTAEDVKL